MCLSPSPQDGSLDLQFFNEEGNNVPVATNCLYTSQDQIHSAVSDRLGNLLIYDVANELTRVADLHLNQRINLMRSYLDSRNRTTLFLFSSLARQASLLSLDHYRPNPSFDFESLLSLQSKLSTLLPSCAGTSPKAYNAYRNPYAQQIQKNRKQLLDSRVLDRFNNISLPLQKKVAQSVGVSLEILLVHLTQLIQ